MPEIVEPVLYSLESAPLDDEPLSEEDRQAVAQSMEWSRHNEPIPHETVLADLVLSMADWEKMCAEPSP